MALPEPEDQRREVERAVEAFLKRRDLRSYRWMTRQVDGYEEGRRLPKELGARVQAAVLRAAESQDWRLATRAIKDLPVYVPAAFGRRADVITRALASRYRSVREAAAWAAWSRGPRLARMVLSRLEAKPIEEVMTADVLAAITDMIGAFPAQKDRSRLVQFIGRMQEAVTRFPQLAWDIQDAVQGVPPALHAAAEAGELCLVEQLIHAGAGVTRRDREGRTPLHYAARKGRSPVTRFLLEHGAKVDAKDERGETPLVVLASAAYMPSRLATDLAALLLAYGAHVNARSNDGSTPLHEAACSGDRYLVELLLRHGAQPNARARDGETPLHAAVSCGARDAVKVLLAYGADPALRNAEGRTPADLADGSEAKAIAGMPHVSSAGRRSARRGRVRSATDYGLP